MKRRLPLYLVLSGLLLSGPVMAQNLYEVSDGRAITGRVTLIYPVMGKDGLSVRQYQKYQQQLRQVASAHRAGRSADDISGALNSLWGNAKSAVGIQDAGDKTRVTLPLNHSRDNDPYSEPEDFREGMSDWKGDGNGGYRARIGMARGDIFNLYLNDKQYNQLVATGFRQGAVVQISYGGKGKNLIRVIN